jgi:pimeloyl-ACP methyl ester carboxylesterase
MAEFVQHLLYHPSPLDDVPQPYLVTAPEPLPSRALPVVVWLHDELTEPTPQGFLEHAFAQSAELRSAMNANPPALLVQPFGRGNASWMGPAGADLFAMLDHLDDRFHVGSVALMGCGAGADGAVQMAAWFPNRFASVALVGGGNDEAAEPSLGGDDGPEWEAAQRQAVTPDPTEVIAAGVPLLLADDRELHEDAAVSQSAHDYVWLFSTEERQPSGFANPQRSMTWRARPMGLFWDRLSIVVGTLADDAEIAELRATAEILRRRWAAGEDSTRFDPGDRTTVVDYRIVADEDFVRDEAAYPGSLVALGSPRTNLLLARWAGELPLSWPDGRDSDAFEIAGVRYDDPSAVAFVLAARPNVERGMVYVLTCASPAGLETLARTNFAFFPDYLVRLPNRVLAWGNFTDA